MNFVATFVPNFVDPEFMGRIAESGLDIAPWEEDKRISKAPGTEMALLPLVAGS